MSFPAPHSRTPLTPDGGSAASHGSFWQRPLGVETVTLSALCLADLVGTLVLVARGEAHEGNQLMAFFLHQGVWHFIGAKIALFVPSLMVAEWYRPRNPRLVSTVLRLVALVYVSTLLIGMAPRFGQLLAAFGGLLGQE